MSVAWLKDVVLGSIGKLAAASLLTASLALTACGDDPVKKGVATGCTLNSDCEGGLVCGFGLCHQQCKDSSDCPTAQTCVKTDTANVCQLATESECHFNSQCEDPLVCAIDQQCRNQCKADKDCLKGQSCADSVCADPEDVNKDGGLKNAVSAGGAGNEPDTKCDAGADCVPSDDPCKVGTISCAGNQMTCDVMADADDGVECGTDKVCSAGKCVACVVGEGCQPEAGNSCLDGEMSCSHGPDCEVTGNVKAGTSCGSDKVCASGECVACVVGEACDPKGEPCKNGVQACSKGPVCNATTNKDAGAACGTDKVCDSGAMCQDCVQDGPCTPTDATCHTGTQDCKNGPICNDSGLSAPDGGVCMGTGTYDFCKAGECEQCQTGNPCIPTNVCHTGTLQCETSPPTCVDAMSNAVDGLACGDAKSCIGGQCLTNDRTLTVTSGAVADVPVDAPFATVTVQLLDKNGAAVTGTPVTVVASAGAYATATNTNPQGKSQISGRVGRALGSNQFTVSAPGATSVDFTVKGVAPTTGQILTYVNVNHLSDVPTTPAPGTLSKLYSEARALAGAADGTLYIADYCAVYKLSTQGVLTRIAGSSATCGDAGDNGPGTSATLYTPSALALDEKNKYLFIAQQGYPRVRLLDLTSGKIFSYAGSSSAPNTAPWGDTQSATGAQAYVNPGALGVAPDGKLYISDQTSGRIRVVDADGATINSFASQGTCSTTGPLTFYSCAYYEGGCHFAWDAAGQMFLSATFCGDGQSTFAGVARVQVDADGKLLGLTRIAGATSGSVPNDVTAINAQFASAPALAFDKAGNLYLTTFNGNRVCRIDALTDHVDTIGGTGEAGAFSGEYVAGTTAKLYNPDSIVLDANNNLYFADRANAAIRGLWNVGGVTAPTGKLALTSGNNQTVKLDAPFASLVVKVTDSAGTAISGVPVRWTRKETGSGLSGGASSVIQTTGSPGTSSMNGRVGLAGGDYHFEASFTDIHGTAVEGSPQTFTVAAADPAAGNIFPVVNFSHTSGTAATEIPAVFSQLQSGSYGIATASDGTIYFSDQCSVFKVSPRGEMTRFAGTGSCTFNGDTGLAVNAALYYPYALALDETRGVLYIADEGNARIRAVTLANGKINTFAGGGSVSTAPWGDGDDPTKASIGSPQSVSVGPDGKVYIPDLSHYSIRVVDPTAATVQIQPYVTATYGSSCVNGVMSLYYANQAAAVRFNSAGEPYVSGYFCEGVTTNVTYAIGKYNPLTKAFTRVTGLYAGTTSDGLATSVHFDDMRDFIFDKNDNIIIAQAYGSSQELLRRINKSDSQLVTIAGDGTAGYFKPGDLVTPPGDYEPATDVRVSTPFRLALWSNGSLLFTDQGNYAVRMIW